MGAYFVLIDQISKLCEKLDREGKLQPLFERKNRGRIESTGVNREEPDMPGTRTL